MLVVSSRHRNTAFTFAHVVIVQRNMYGVRLSIYDFYLNRFPRRTYRRTRLDDSGTVFQNSVGNSIIFYFRTIVTDAKQVLDLLVFVCVFVDRKRTTRSTRYLFYFIFFFFTTRHFCFRRFFGDGNVTFRRLPNAVTCRFPRGHRGRRRARRERLIKISRVGSRQCARVIRN